MMGRGSNYQAAGSDSKIHSISDLPRDILLKILVKVSSVKWILVCKTVCKSWYALISDPEFAKLHFDQGVVCPLLESWYSLYIVEPEYHDFEHIDPIKDVNFKLDSIFEMPSPGFFSVNSCNGLLLLELHDPSDNEILSVCNPVTGELIYLPEGKTIDPYEHFTYCGLGFGSTSNQYKVMRMICSKSSPSTSQERMVEVHVVGTESWKDLGSWTLSLSDSHPAYVNGFVYWPCDSDLSLINSFDVDKECFRSFCVKGGDHLDLIDRVSMGEFGQELCVGYLKSGAFHVWAMKDYCEEKAWSRVFSFQLPSYGERFNGPLRPMKYLNCGSLLMYNGDKEALICIDSRKSAVGCLKIHGNETSLSLIYPFAHISSFVSLKHILSRQKEKVEVLIHDQRETRDHYAVAQDFYTLFSDSDSD